MKGFSMKSFKYITIAYLLSSAISIQAMDNSNNCGDDYTVTRPAARNNNNNLTNATGKKRSASALESKPNEQLFENEQMENAYIEKIATSIEKTLKCSLANTLEKDLKKCDPQAPDVFFNYLTGKMIEAGDELGISYSPFHATYNAISIEEILKQDFNTYSIDDIARTIRTKASATINWIFSNNDYYPAQRLISAEEREIFNKIECKSEYHIGTINTLAAQIVKRKTQAIDSQELIKKILTKAKLNNVNDDSLNIVDEHINRQGYYGIEAWFENKRKEQVQRLQAFKDVQYKDPYTSKTNKKYIVELSENNNASNQ